MVTSTIQTVGVFGGLSLGLTATKHIAEWRERQPERAAKIIGLTLQSALITVGLCCALCYRFAPWLSFAVFKAPYLASDLRLSCGLLLFNTLFGLQTGILTGFEAFKTLALVNSARSLIYLPATVIGAKIWGLTGAIGGMVAGTSVGWLICELAVHRECRLAGIGINWRCPWSEWRALWDFSAPAVLASTIVFPVGWIANAMLVRQSSGYEEMGIFSAANQWRLALVFIPAIVNQALLPILADLHGGRDNRQFRSLLRASLLLVLLVSISAAIPVLLFSGRIMGAFGAAFVKGRSVLLLLTLAAILSNVVGPLGSALSSMGRMWTALALNFIWACAFLFLAKELIGMGAIGLGIAYSISYAIHLLVVTFYLIRLDPATSPFVSVSEQTIT